MAPDAHNQAGERVPPAAWLVEQLGTLEALAGEHRAAAAGLRAELAALNTHVGDLLARLGALEAGAATYERLLAGLRQSLAAATVPPAAPGASDAHERQLPGAAPEQPSPAGDAAPASTPAPAAPAAPRPASPPAHTAPEASPPAHPPARSEPGVVVQRGTTVEVAFDDGSIETYTLVRPNEANAVQNLISEASPLGMALLGARVGETRSYRVKNGGPEIMVRVREVSP